MKDVLDGRKDGFEAEVDEPTNPGRKAIGLSESLGFRHPVAQHSSKVTDALTRGARLTDQEMANLKAQGFKSVVNLCAESDEDTARATQLGMSSLHIPMDAKAAPTTDQIKQFLDFVTRPQNQPAYVHCEAGAGRTGVAVACYRMAVQGWPPAAAFAESSRFRLNSPVHVGAIRQFGDDLKAGKIPGYPLK